MRREKEKERGREEREKEKEKEKKRWRKTGFPFPAPVPYAVCIVQRCFKRERFLVPAVLPHPCGMRPAGERERERGG